MGGATGPIEPASAPAELGRRLRAVRHARGLSLGDVERSSEGRWTSSAVGAYERGFRTISLHRLRQLADFYGVTVAELIGDAPLALPHPIPAPRQVVLDLRALGRRAGAETIRRYAWSIATERGDFNGRVLSVRQDDVRAISAMLDLTEEEVVVRLEEWGLLAGR